MLGSLGTNFWKEHCFLKQFLWISGGVELEIFQKFSKENFDEKLSSWRFKGEFEWNIPKYINLILVRSKQMISYENIRKFKRILYAFDCLFTKVVLSFNFQNVKPKIFSKPRKNIWNLISSFHKVIYEKRENQSLYKDILATQSMENCSLKIYMELSLEIALNSYCNS